MWTDTITAEGNTCIGTSRVTLRNSNCGYSECNIGNFYTDALLHAYLQLGPYSTREWTNASIAITASGEMRTSILPGNVTYEQMYDLCIYESNLVTFDLAGNHLLAALEHSVSAIDLEKNISETYSFLQYSGLRVTYDLHAIKGNRVVNAEVRCTACAIPAYEPLSATKVYRIIATKYVAHGGHELTIFAEFGSSRKTLPINELSALISYTKVETPIITGLEGRTKIV